MLQLHVGGLCEERDGWFRGVTGLEACACYLDLETENGDACGRVILHAYGDWRDSGS